MHNSFGWESNRGLHLRLWLIWKASVRAEDAWGDDCPARRYGLSKAGFYGLQFLACAIRFWTWRHLFEEQLQFCDRTRSLLLLLKYARRHAMRKGVRLPQRMRLAAGRDGFVKAPLLEVSV